MVLIAVWAAVIGVGIYLVCFHREQTQQELRAVMSASLWGASIIYLVLTVIRGLIFLPAAPLLLVGIAIFPPWLMFWLTMAGTLISMAAIYLFPDLLKMDDLVRTKKGGMIERVRSLLPKHGMAVIVLWSFLPFTPTGFIVYACGELRMRFSTTMLGVALGSAAYFALIIFSGDHLMRLAGWK